MPKFPWPTGGERISATEKLNLLSITGGVPKYLEEVDPGFSSEENIRRLCFQREGILFREFEQIWSDVFGKRAAGYKTIVAALAHGSRTVQELSVALGKERSGHLSDYLADLVLGGFLAKDTVFEPASGRDTRLQRFRLRDNYARFYLRTIAPRRDLLLRTKHSLYVVEIKHRKTIDLPRRP